MKCCTCCALLILSVICVQAEVNTDLEDSYNMKIINTSQNIVVHWESPDKQKSVLCYRTHLQYRSQCDTSWKNYTNILGFFFVLNDYNIKKNYAFRIRMKLCTKKFWGKWSPVKYWKNDTDFIRVPCITDKSSFSVQNYLLIAMLSLAGSILVCAITHNRVRRFVLPIIPDPKKKMLNFEQMQWWSNFAQTVEDFKVSEVKIYDGEEKMIEITLLSDLDEQPSHTLPTHTVPGKHDFDLATNASTYTIYSSATTEDNIDAQCSATRPGYIII